MITRYDPLGQMSISHFIVYISAGFVRTLISVFLILFDCLIFKTDHGSLGRLDPSLLLCTLVEVYVLVPQLSTLHTSLRLLIEVLFHERVFSENITLFLFSFVCFETCELIQPCSIILVS